MVIHAHRDDAQGPRHELRRARALGAVCAHIIHVTVPAAREPFREACAGGAQVAVRDADLLEPELLTPRLDIAGEPNEIQRALIDLLHTGHLKPPLTLHLPQEADTLALGSALAATLVPGLVVYLEGELGAGKTTLVRGVLRALGFSGRVKSPTFTLVEPYNCSRLDLYHFDFYRFENAQNVADTGFREYFGGSAVCFVEWPEKAAGLPPADVRITLSVMQTGRTAELHAESEAGTRCLERLQQAGIF